MILKCQTGVSFYAKDHEKLLFEEGYRKIRVGICGMQGIVTRKR
jgi:hypothetical protein